MKKGLAIATCLTLLFGVLAGCSNSSAPAEPTGSTTPAEATKTEPLVLKWSINSEPPSMDPGIAVDADSFDMIYAAFEGLTSYDLNGQLVNATAESFTNSPDYMNYTFKIRKDAKWSNGDPVTAHDFVYAIKRNLDPKTASEYAYQLYYIKGGEEYNTGKGKAEDVGVKAVDDYTVEFNLKSPTPFFRELTFFPTLFPLHQKTLEANPKWADEAKTIVGNGPFIMDTWEHKSKIVFTKNPNYWDKNNVKLDRIEIAMIEDNNTAFSMFENGDIDWGGYPASTLPTDAIPTLKDAGKLMVADNPGTQSVVFNTTKPPFNNKKIRQAFAYAINRQEIIDNILQTGVPAAYGWVPTSMGLKPDGYFKEDQAKAKALLEEGMKELGLSTFPTVTYTFDTNDTNKKLAEALQDQWKKALGVNVKLYTAELKVYRDMRSQANFDMIRFQWGADFNDPINFLEMFRDKTGGNNHPDWENAKFKELIDKSYNEPDLDARKKILLEAETILMEEMPLAPINFRGSPYVKNDKVKDFIIFPLGGAYFKYTSVNP
ncbi:peptide ABC transporter substrate-binding protein [Brevibacillus brevis]|uniref:peptide ABC transporter substrate-binding protein n=1 Tax=Brevibacillus brevis TaxID=1393 RepID=UPI000D106D6E|nr:peptide ABC transporter substrate-binding protein [Brevibacillus brevis]PSJ71344.1 ABC transporter substrate-binding protein [Brevibacillus brevis]RED28957.1 oligopeptide transport system substrate-binding protein [Brevibacillus brevis]GEC93805.1 oligopeptide-binding protein OppA [Brevibacillus brevis]VEF91448.1 Stage 0 sporulation protein KA [Brevibacillus brevis]